MYGECQVLHHNLAGGREIDGPALLLQFLLTGSLSTQFFRQDDM